MSSPATSGCLPQELIDRVIDELRDDPGSLRACSLVSKPWVHRSRKHLFATVHLSTWHLQRWLEHIPTNPVTPPGLHHHVRSLSLQPATAPAAFCIPETFADHLTFFTQVSKLTIASSLREKWTDAFLDSALVTKYFGGLGQSLRELELTRVHLNMVVLKALLDVLPQLEQLLIFSPIMVREETKGVEAFPRLQEHQSVAEGGGSSSVVVPCRNVPIRRVDSIMLLFPPNKLIVGLTGLPLRCRELVLAEESDYGGDVLNLLLGSTGPTLESLVIQNMFDRGSTITLENCPILRKLKTKAPYNGMPAYINDQARLIQTVTSPFLGRIVFLGKWDGSQVGRTTDRLEPVNWEIVDRELCSLMDRLDEEVKLEVVFADGALSDASCKRTDGVHTMLLNGMRGRGGIVKVQQEE